jgi:pimeloyl-ACP methyl ester carboxylesterase
VNKKSNSSSTSTSASFGNGIFDSLMKSYDEFDKSEQFTKLKRNVRQSDRVAKAMQYKAGKVARSLRVKVNNNSAAAVLSRNKDGAQVADATSSLKKSEISKIPVAYPDATKPTIYKLTDAERVAMGELDADEMHFVPIPNENWSVSLLRYLPKRSSANVDYLKPPVIFIPGCASNAYTFDVDANDGFSMPRLIAEKQNREVWICESRGVGHARNHETPLESYTRLVIEEDIEDQEQYESNKKKSQMKKKSVSVPKIKPTVYGGWDFDTYVLDDLPTAFTYIRNVIVNEGRAKKDTFEYDLIGHSMGGMLACAVAARSQQEHPEWSVRKVIALASSLECSSTNAQTVPSIYARFAALAGHLPRGLTGGSSAIPKIHLPLQPVSVGTAELFTRVLGPPDEKRQEDVSNPASAFWNNSVSATTCYPGATSAKFLRKLLVYGFDNVPLSLLLQMCTLFTPGGMRSREGLRTFFTESKRPSEITIFGENKYKEDPSETQKPVINYVEAFANSNVPLLCIAADSDPIFPPEQVKAFAKRVNGQYVCVGDGSINDAQVVRDENIDKEKEHNQKIVANDAPEMVDANGEAVPSHMSHYDVLCGKRAPALVYPKILAFLEEEK